MPYMKRLATLSFVSLAGTVTASAGEVVPAIVAGGDTTVVYVFPTSPQSFVPVAGLPSYLVMPGANIPPVATQVVYSAPVPAALSQARPDVHCGHFDGTVAVVGADVFALDADGDKIGCEAEDR